MRPGPRRDLERAAGRLVRTRRDANATGYDPSYVPTRYTELELPETQRLCDEAVWIPQEVLLGDATDLEDIATAAEKIRRSSRALQSSA